MRSIVMPDVNTDDPGSRKLPRYKNGKMPFRTAGNDGVPLQCRWYLDNHLRPKKPYTVVALSKSYRVPDQDHHRHVRLWASRDLRLF